MALPDPYNVTADNAAITADTTRYLAGGGVFLPATFDPTSLRNPGTNLYEIPVLNPPCVIAVDLPTQPCRLRFTYCNAGEGAWIMDVSTEADVPLVHGIPLVTGLDLLGPYRSLGLGARMFIVGTGDPSEVPAFADLGSTARLYLETAA